MTRSHLISALVAFAAALVLASSALAGGEPKNVAPFTRAMAPAKSAPSVAGEPKDMVPFTRPATRVPVAPDWFERYAAAHPYGQGLTTIVTEETHVFSWDDALLGAGTTAALALMIGALGLTRRVRLKHVLGA